MYQHNAVDMQYWYNNIFCLSVCLSVWHVLVLYWNGLTYCQLKVTQLLNISAKFWWISSTGELNMMGYINFAIFYCSWPCGSHLGRWNQGWHKHFLPCEKLSHSEIYASSSGHHCQCRICFLPHENAPWQFTLVTLCALLILDLSMTAKTRYTLATKLNSTWSTLFVDDVALAPYTLATKLTVSATKLNISATKSTATSCQIHVVADFTLLSNSRCCKFTLLPATKSTVSATKLTTLATKSTVSATVDFIAGFGNSRLSTKLTVSI